MAVYDEKVLKGQELEYYTRKLKATLKDIEDRMDGAIDALSDKVDELEKQKLQLQLVDHEVTEPCYVYNNTTYPTRDAAEEAAIGDIDSTTTPGKYIFNGVTYDTLEEATQAAKDAVKEGERVIELVLPDGTIIKHNADPSADPPEIEPSHQFIYLVPAGAGDPATETIQPNYCNEYIWNDDRLEFELIGSTDVDLQELTNEDIDTIWNKVFA